VCTLATVVDTLVDDDLISPAVLVVGDVVQAAPLWHRPQSQGTLQTASIQPGR
jgi:siroheme synthase